MCKSYRGLNFSKLIGFILLGAVSYTTWAAPEEIQVYMDEVSTPGEIGLDIHQNYVFSGSDVPEYLGAQTPRHVFRLTPEFSYGLTPNLELGAYVLMSRDTNANSTVDGQKVRLKYIASKLPNQAYFVGANLEIGRVDHRLNENPWNGELKGIYGYRTDQWTYAINANLDFKVSGPVASPSTLNLASKISYKGTSKNEFMQPAKFSG